MAAVVQKPWAVPGASLQASRTTERSRLSFVSAAKNAASCTFKVRRPPLGQLELTPRRTSSVVHVQSAPHSHTHTCARHRILLHV